MKRIVSMVCIVVLVAPAFAFAETPVEMKARLELEYQPHRRTQRIGWIVAGAGLGLAIASAAVYSTMEPSVEEPPPVPIIAGFGIGGVMLYGGVGVSLWSLWRTRGERTEIRGVGYVVDGFTQQEADAIIAKGYFIGMSQDALRLAMRPQRINVKQTGGSRSEQWVYRNGLYIYTDGRRVTSYQRTR